MRPSLWFVFYPCSEIFPGHASFNVNDYCSGVFYVTTRHMNIRQCGEMRETPYHWRRPPIKLFSLCDTTGERVAEREREVETESLQVLTSKNQEKISSMRWRNEGANKWTFTRDGHNDSTLVLLISLLFHPLEKWQLSCWFSVCLWRWWVVLRFYVCWLTEERRD